MERISRVLAGLMLLLCALLLAAGLTAGTLLDLGHPSFVEALALACLLLAVLMLLEHKMRPWLAWFEGLGPVRCGILLVVLFLAVNGLWLAAIELKPDGDYSIFWQTAVLLSRGEQPGGNLNLYLRQFPHLLGYAGFLSPFLRLFGESTVVAEILNLFLTGLSCLLLYLLCLDWLGLHAAVLAALFWTFLPSKLFYNAMVLSEPLYTCLLLVFLWLAHRLDRQERLPAALLIGALSGLVLRMMNMARPIAPVPVIASCIWILLLRGKAPRGKRSWLNAGAFLALLLAVYLGLGPFAQRGLTTVLGGAPATVPGYNIYVGFNPDTDGSFSEEDVATFEDVLNGPAEGDVSLAQREMLSLAIERAKSVDLFRLLIGKLRIFLGRDQSAVYHSKQVLSGLPFKLCVAACNVCFFLLILLSLLGLWRLWRRRTQNSLLLVPFYIVGLTLAQMLAEVSDRYHYSLVPMLVILGAASCGDREERNS